MVKMEIYELLDRFELLYEDTNPDISDLRRTVIDKDLPSLFRILKKYEDDELIENIRSAICDLNTWAFYKIYKNEDAIDFKKFILNDNIWSLFKILQKSYPNKDRIIEELRRTLNSETFTTRMRPVFSAFKNDKFTRNYYIATNTEHASGQAKLNATFNVVDALVENNEIVTNLRAIVAHDNRPAMYNCLDYVLDSDLVRILERFEKEKPEYNLHDAFTQGQLRSKLWLLKHLRDIDLGTVFICAGWYGTLARAMFENERIHFDKIRSFDIDEKCVEVADMINKQWNKDDWAFKALHSDILDVNYTEHSWTFWSTKNNRESYPIIDSPNTIINTSCEHIENFTKWFSAIPKDKLVALQTNNYFELSEHVNCVKDINQFKQQAPLNNIIYEGELVLEKYTRYMLIGYK
tara:strand:+ start:725 stop:1945 length:1221 start_codon:yes stop_codon:yes gene_type:complete